MVEDTLMNERILPLLCDDGETHTPQRGHPEQGTTKRSPRSLRTFAPSAVIFPAYLDEMCIRFDNRKNPCLLRDTILKLIASPMRSDQNQSGKISSTRPGTQ